MIESLSISNYALIDKIDLTFQPGFNIITGETGAGKSIMLGALSVLLGNRADTKVVRNRDKKSIVEASFILNNEADDIKNLLAEIAPDVDWEPESLILRREISPNGRSRSFVNDTPVALSTLHDVALRLVDLHSQHQNLLLASPDYQLSIIDTLIPDKSVLDLYKEAYNQYRADLKAYVKAHKSVEAAKKEEEYLRYQLLKLNEVELEEGIQEELERRRDMLSSVASIKAALQQLSAIFSGDDDTSLVNRMNAAEQLIDLTDTLPNHEDLARRTASLAIDIKDLAGEFDSAYSSLDVDPEQLEQTEQHLSEIYDLQRRHSVTTVEQLIALRDSIAAKIAAIDTADDHLKALASRAKKAKAKAIELAAKLSEARAKVANEFVATLRESAIPLGMKNLQFVVDIQPADLSLTGADAINFLFAFNKNQPLMPVKDTASGGEISRLMLSVKAILADRMNLPSIIFDEVDTGVSGDVANRMGQLMQQISKRIQVIAITHLPQVAAKGVAHFKVYKADTETATQTYVNRLSEQERVDELTLMLSGDVNNQAARATAQSLLDASK